MNALLVHPAVLAAIGYLAATMLFQFRPWSTRLLGLDQFGILPRWKFFVPQPDQQEILLVMRGAASEGELGDWMPVSLFPPRTPLSWLWSPGAYHGSILMLSADRAATQVLHSAGPMPDTLAYRTLERHVRQCAAQDGHAVFQFALRKPSGEILFIAPALRR